MHRAERHLGLAFDSSPCLLAVHHSMEGRNAASNWHRSSLASAPLLMAQQGLSKSLLPFSRCYSTAPPPPPPQPGNIPPPTKGTAASSLRSGAVGSNSAAAAASAASRAWKPSFAILAPTFLFTHVTLAWALVPPVYLFLRTTNLSNTLLAGPQGAWFLSRKVPDWVPDTMVDRLVGGLPADGHAVKRPTVEELIERLARRGIRILFNVGNSAFSAFRKGSGEEDALAKAALRELRGGLGLKSEEVRDKADGIKEQIKGYTRRQAQGAVSEIQFGQIRDGVAAWVFVKILLPLRIPLSLFLTPKVARGLKRAFSR